MRTIADSTGVLVGDLLDSVGLRRKEATMADTREWFGVAGIEVYPRTKPPRALQA